MAGGGVARGQRLLDEYETYDAHVDVVSALEWLFTGADVKDLPDTVAHFERFPRIPVNGVVLTPDFTVLFTDDTAVVGEIASIAVHDNSVDKLCHQIGGYAALPGVPAQDGSIRPVAHLDVMQIVPARVGNAAVKRIIEERLADTDHAYKPDRPPCIVQYSRDQGTYTLQRNQSPSNGTIVVGERAPNIATYLDNDLNIKPEKFVGIKTLRAFVNDPVPPLYLATHLWIRTWPNMLGAGSDDVEIEISATMSALREYYGVGRAKEVRGALHLLASAGLAAELGGDRWLVSRRLLGRSGDRDVHKIIAKRSATPTKPLVKAPRRPPAPTPDDTLF